MKIILVFLGSLAVALLAACGGEPATDLQDSIVESTPATNDVVTPSAIFDPSGGVIPFPNNLLFSGSLDGTLEIPVDDATDFSDPKVAMNALDGFSTIAPFSSGFSTAIDATSISPTSVKVYEVVLSGPGGAVVAVVRQLAFGVDFFAAISSVDTSQSTLAIVPLLPLPEKTSYMVVITDDLLADGGLAFAPSVTYRLLKNLTDPLVFGDPALPGALRSLTEEDLASFEVLRQIITFSEATAAGSDASIEVANIIQSWSFTTQSIGDVLAKVRTDIRDAAAPASVLVDTTIDSPLGAADIFAGTVDVPYYLTAASGVNDPTPLGSFWKGLGDSNLTQFNPTPIATSTQTVPLMVSVPKAPMPVDGYPVVIFQHGITSNRATMMALADSMGAPPAGIAVVAIDMPLHGLTGNETDGTEGFFAGAAERTFNLDLVTQVGGSTTAAAPDGVTDSSGAHFINLSNLLNSRDNLRQAVSDLFALTFAIEGMSAGGETFDSDRIYFIGHSLGAIVGTTFTALESNVRDAVFVFGGGSVPKILDGSAAFSPTIVAGLAAAGVVKGTPDYETFLGAAQTVVDSGDPVNHTAGAVAGRGVLFVEIAGGSTSPSDLVVPNTVPDGNDSSDTVPAPLAGTEPMLELMGLTQVNTSGAGVDLTRSVKFVVGNHSSLLSAAADAFNDETTNAAVRLEIQTLAATFLATDGGAIAVTDGDLLQVPAP